MVALLLASPGMQAASDPSQVFEYDRAAAIDFRHGVPVGGGAACENEFDDPDSPRDRMEFLEKRLALSRTP
jgi:hypothetical protein